MENAPPVVAITERWWIWETGILKVSSDHFPIARVRVTILDPQNKRKEVRFDFEPDKNLFKVKWDRYFGDGTVASAGQYPVLAVACDVNGLCGQDEGRIVIPEMMTSAVTITPSPTATSTLIASATPVATLVPPTPTLAWNTPIPEEIPEPARYSLPLWQILSLIGLFMVIASASLVDPRPKALERLGETFTNISTKI